MKLFVFVTVCAVAASAVLGAEDGLSKDNIEMKTFLDEIKLEEQKMWNAYNKVRETLTKSLGLSRQNQDRNLPLVLEQIQDNLNQVGTSINEVGSLVRRVVTNGSSDVRKTVMKQFRGFTDMWSKHMRDISKVLEDRMALRQELQQPGLLEVANRYIQQLSKNVQTFYTDLFRQVRNRVNSNLPPSN